MKGKFVLAPFPFTDLTASKLRPTLVTFEGKSYVVVAFVSSRIPDEFGSTGLKVASVVRLDKVATVIKYLIVGELGEVVLKLRKEINKKIAETYRILKSISLSAP